MKKAFTSYRPIGLSVCYLTTPYICQHYNYESVRRLHVSHGYLAYPSVNDKTRDKTTHCRKQSEFLIRIKGLLGK